MNLRSYLFAFVLFCTGCASAGTSPPVAPAPTAPSPVPSASPTVTNTPFPVVTATPASYSLSFQSFTASGAPTPPAQWAVVYPGNVSNASQQALQVSIDPPPLLLPAIAWTSSNNTAATVSQLSSANAFYSFAAPPRTTYVNYVKPGPTIVTATIGPPVNTVASIPVFSYNWFYFACGEIGISAATFNPEQTITPSSAGPSDLYITEPVEYNSYRGSCSRTATGTPSTIQFPYGGTTVSGDISTLPAIRADQWTNATTSMLNTQTPTILLFKTSQGLIVKFFYPYGPYEVSAPGGGFPF